MVRVVMPVLWVAWAWIIIGCTRGSYVEGFIKDTPIELSLEVNGKKTNWVEVKTGGADTRVDFNGRSYVIKGVTKGYALLTFDHVNLSLEGLDVRITDQYLDVTGRHYTINSFDVSSIPQGKRVEISGPNVRIY